MASALGWSATIVAPSALGSHGSVTKEMSLGRSPDRLAASASRPSESARPLSVAIDFDDSLSTRQRRSGSVSSPEPVTSWISDDRKICCRLIRLMSEPSPMLCRTRTNASASSPLTRVRPAGRSTPDFESCSGRVRHTSTPPRASIVFLKPLKSSTTKWSTVRPVIASTVFTVHPGPPRSKAALNRSRVAGSARAVGVLAGGQVDDRVARDAHDHGRLAVRVDVQQHGGVRPGALEVAVALVALAGPLVGAHEQEGDRPLGQVAVVDGSLAHLAADVDLRDVVLELPDGDGRRAGGHCQRQGPGRGHAATTRRTRCVRWRRAE